MMFVKFPSLTRFSHDWVITEKIDGTNAHVWIDPLASADDKQLKEEWSLGKHDGLHILAGSRTRFITPKDDNHGFAAWVETNAEGLINILGEGRHYGEWCGGSIQRGYGLKTKRFALFNTHKWGNVEFALGFKGGDLSVVPVLAKGYMEDPGKVAVECMSKMKDQGSVFAPGFMDPEGVVMRHNPSGTVFKKTFDYDEQGKWAENQARKNSA